MKLDPNIVPLAFFFSKSEKFASEDLHFHIGNWHFVKLHSELALPTELQLDRVGVDFVFPPSQLITSNQNLPEGSVLQTWYLAHRLNSQN